MTDPLKRTKLEPIGTRDAHAIGLGVVKLEMYSHATETLGNEIRSMRVSAGIGLREAAKRAGLSALELSEIQMGAVRFEDPEAALAFLLERWR